MIQQKPSLFCAYKLALIRGVVNGWEMRASARGKLGYDRLAVQVVGLEPHEKELTAGGTGKYGARQRIDA